MSASPLFRPEALAQLRSTGLVQSGGLVRLSSPWAPGAAVLAVAVLVGLGFMLARGEVARRIPLFGELVPAGGYLEVQAPAMGWVASWWVQEGQVVAEGTALALVRTERSVAQGDVSVLQEQALARRLQTLESVGDLLTLETSQRLGQLDARRRSLQGEHEALRADRRLLQERLALQEQTMQRDRALLQQGFLSEAHLQSRSEERLELALRLGQIDRQLTALVREQDALAAESAQWQTQHRRQALDVQSERLRLEQETSESRARQGLVLRAPQAGRVVMRARQEGQSVQPGQILVGLVPHDAQSAALQAVLRAPPQAVALIRPGMPVWLRCPSFSVARHGLLRGTVVEVGEVPLPGAVGASGSSAGPGYRVVVALADGPRSTRGSWLPLKPGLSLQADVLLESRSLLAWWFEPLVSRWHQWRGDPFVRSALGPGGPGEAVQDARSDAL